MGVRGVRCRQLKLWHAEGIAPAVLSVNVSGVQLKGRLRARARGGGKPVALGHQSGRLELELTESVLMEATQRHSNTLENLRLLGTKIPSTISAPAIRRSNI